MDTTNNTELYDIYELMITPSNKKGQMLIREIEKKGKANLNLVSDLIVLGANLDWQNNNGWTALHWCAVNNHSRIARMLLDAGANLNIQDNYGRTALHRCARWNSPEIARMLIDAGADKTISDNEGSIPYELAKTQELKELLKP